MVALAVGLVPVLAIVGVGVYLVVEGALRGARGAGEIVGGSFALLGGLVLVIAVRAIAQRVIQKPRPHEKAPELTLQLDRTVLHPGAEVAGRVAVVKPGEARDLLVALRCCDRSGSLTGTSWRARRPLPAGALTAGMTFPFAFSLPPGAPPNYAEDGAEIWWEVQIRCVAAQSTTTARRIEVALDADERAGVVLQAPQAPVRRPGRGEQAGDRRKL